ncbi:insulinase family protein, partial [Myxococcota bacterium]|nr:insulinase family protein [Myxococcota bacterium]
VVVAGNLDADAMLQAVEEDFSSMPRGERASAKKVPPPVKKPILRFVRDASSQIDLRISFRAPALQESSYSAVFMLSRVLADGLASRMYSELVDKRGLAYVLSAGLTTYEEVSLFDFEVSVASDRASELVRALLDFAHRSRRFRYNDEELERVLRRYRYGMEFMSDVPVDLAGWYGRGVLFGMEAETHALESQLLNVDAARLREAARSLFIPEGMVLAASGDLARGEWKKIREAVDEWSSLQK